MCLILSILYPCSFVQFDECFSTENSQVQLTMLDLIATVQCKQSRRRISLLDVSARVYKPSCSVLTATVTMLRMYFVA